MKFNKKTLSFSTYTSAMLLIFILGNFLRFYNLNWDLGQYLHPDERLYINASNLTLPHSLKEFLSPTSPLNPHMFYYGSFPLYLYKFIASFFLNSLDLLIVSRMISAAFSSLSIIFVYLLSKQYFSEKAATISAFIFAITPGSIQYAHFNTTESLLIFLMLVLLYMSTRLYKEKNLHYGFYLGVILGLAYATKIVGLTFGIFPAIVYILFFFENKNDRANILISCLIFIFSTAIVGFIMAPYQIIDWVHFSQEQSYMQAVTYGKFKPPFVIIFEGTLPYIYPLTRVLPYTFGFAALLSALAGGYLVVKHEKRKITVLLLTIFPILYFLWAGAWYAKFSRYYLLLVPFLSIYAGIFLSQIHNYHRRIILFFILLQGLLFFRVYLVPNTRIVATNWINQNLPNNAKIATEYWDDALPLQLPSAETHKSFVNIQLSVYDEDTKDKIKKLSETIAKSDYIVLSSRRVYASILNNDKTYPYTTKFYKSLFNQDIGYIKIKEFTNYPYMFSDDQADESFQSYDHPPVLIFKNTKKESKEIIESRLLQ